MKRLSAILLALVTMGLLVYGAIAAPPGASNPPIALTPGQDQPLTCSTLLVGTLSDPACATPTATPLPPVQVFGVNNGSVGLLYCNAGYVAVDLGTITRTGGGNTFTGIGAQCVPGPTATPTP